MQFEGFTSIFLRLDLVAYLRVLFRQNPLELSLSLPKISVEPKALAQCQAADKITGFIYKGLCTSQRCRFWAQLEQMGIADKRTGLQNHVREQVGDHMQIDRFGF